MMLSANTLIIVRIAEPFWCLAGLIIAYYHLAPAESNLETSEVKEKSTVLEQDLVKGEI